MRLNDYQARMYQEIARFIDAHGYAPSFRDLARACGYASVNTVKHHLEMMRAKGFIDYQDRIARSIVLLGSDEELPA